MKQPVRDGGLQACLGGCMSLLMLSSPYLPPEPLSAAQEMSVHIEAGGVLLGAVTSQGSQGLATQLPYPHCCCSGLAA